jgi:excisionase family DNA binding protein
MSAAIGASQKIAGEHRERLAVIYVRQSTLAQVRDHGESTQRQYALTEEAERMGWAAERVLVIDADLGVSGRGGSGRAGFKELVGRVCCGEVGAIFGLEVSRLARSSADLRRLLELCSLTDTLIVDGDGVYDLDLFNDRLLLGLKGTMSEAELHLLAGRLQGARRAGSALLQGIVRCGCCGRSMATFYRDGKPGYDCTYSRADRTAAPGCRGVMGEVIEQAVAERLLAVVAPEQIALALKAADTVTERCGRATRAVELRAERARYDAARAERAFHQCDPDNRLVARNLEKRWEGKLRELTDAEAELALKAAEPPPPARSEIEALARDLPALWSAPSTSHRDRKRLLRALIGDVTLTSQPDQPEVRVGIHWRSGATEELTVLRPAAARTARAAAAGDLLRQLGPTHTNAQLAEHLNRAGHLTAGGRPFDEDSVRWLRWKHRIPSPSPLRGDEIGVHELAEQLDIGDHVIYKWIKKGKLKARRAGRRRLAIPFNEEIEAACRQRLASSPRTRYRSKTHVAGGAE